MEKRLPVTKLKSTGKTYVLKGGFGKRKIFMDLTGKEVVKIKGKLYNKSGLDGYTI